MVNVGKYTIHGWYGIDTPGLNQIITREDPILDFVRLLNLQIRLGDQLTERKIGRVQSLKTERFDTAAWETLLPG